MSTATKKKADAAAAAAAAEDGAPEGKSRKKLLVIGVVVVLVAAAAAWFFLFRGAGEAAAEEAEPEPVPGAVVALEPVSINLAEGRYLRLGIALQAVKESKEEPEGSQALDLAITLFTGRSTAELADPAARAALKAELVEQMEKAYHGEVMDVYFTEFVTQ